MRVYFAEFVGTFVLVLGGVGSAVIAGSKIGNVGVALAFGLALLAMAYTIGPISGCHINPAVTFGVMLRGKIRGTVAAGYMAAQVLGAILAAGLLLVIVRGSEGGYIASLSGLGANGYGLHSPSHYSLLSAFVAEAILSAFLVVTVLGATSNASAANIAGIPIGLVLTLIHLVDIPITNASVNPARSIGPAVFVGGWAMSQLWLFIVAPLCGALLAAGVHAVMSSNIPKAAPSTTEQILARTQTRGVTTKAA